MGLVCSRGTSGTSAGALPAPAPEPRSWQYHAAAFPRANSGGAPPTLQELCMRALAQRGICEDDVARIPPALAHALLDEYVASRRLDESVFVAFSRACRIYDCSLAHLPGVTDAWLESLALQAPTLQRLSLCGCVGVSDRSLRAVGACTQLRSLSLAGCTRLTDEGLASLASLSLLTELSLQGCVRLTGAATKHLGRLTKLVSLDLSTCRGVTSLAPLRSLAQLERLLLGWTAAADEDMQHVAECRSLTQLQLCRTRVGDAGVAALAGRLPMLRQLDLTGCRVSDASSAALASFTRLTALSLAGCAVRTRYGYRGMLALVLTSALSILQPARLAAPRCATWGVLPRSWRLSTWRTPASLTTACERASRRSAGWPASTWSAPP
jgi:hypothetical protein